MHNFRSLQLIIRLNHHGTFHTLLLNFTGNPVRLMDISGISFIICMAAAGAEEFCPAVHTFRLAEHMVHTEIAHHLHVLESLKNSITTAKTVVSIAAGISIAYVRKGLECDCPVVRVMPNTPLLLKKGATALCPSENISDDDKTIVYNMFAGSGVCEYIDESHMNEIIAVNGSSPAYIYLFAKAMADYAKNCGIDYDKAMNLVCATLEGSAAMLRDSGEPVETLIDRVCSKGGTTIAAMDKLKEHGFYEAVLDGMDACTKRAEELGK